MWHAGREIARCRGTYLIKVDGIGGSVALSSLLLNFLFEVGLPRLPVLDLQVVTDLGCCWNRGGTVHLCQSEADV